MKFSTRTRYGLRLLVYLAQRYGERRYVRLSEIAENENISRKYLEQIIIVLKRMGILDVSRGVHGGYRLHEDPATITLEQVFTILEGDICPIFCIKTPHNCPRETTCPVHDLWKELYETMKDFLRRRTLAQLAAQRNATGTSFPSCL